ncbi:tetraacyldisaccharide 4'-kinase [Algoriphagus aestuarii]|nr:tetraacyldisaccharide 4'-kinase [Algoriphagus aestuarii]
MRPYAFLLYPFAVLYDMVTRVRNKFFDWGWFKITKSPIKSILVGNLSVGGTGKTPMVEYLIRKLNSNYSIATLSRGYGRKTKGFLKATKAVIPSEIGDEPFQIFGKFGDQISVFVGENRVEALEKIAWDFPENELVILDDAFQHRYVKADLDILLTTFDRPFFSDFLLPAGRLRESRNGAKRADLIVVTKSPGSLPDEVKKSIKSKVSQYNLNAPVLFSSIGYGDPFALGFRKEFSKQVILLSGIANDSQLKEFVAEKYQLLETIKYPDHHDYGKSDFEKIRHVFSQHSASDPVILTTEKDAVKVKSTCPEGFLREIPIFVLPIQVVFSPEDEQVMESFIDQVILQ